MRTSRCGLPSVTRSECGARGQMSQAWREVSEIMDAAGCPPYHLYTPSVVPARLQGGGVQPWPDRVTSLYQGFVDNSAQRHGPIWQRWIQMHLRTAFIIAGEQDTSGLAECGPNAGEVANLGRLVPLLIDEVCISLSERRDMGGRRVLLEHEG
jgi:hypothetical protein